MTKLKPCECKSSDSAPWKGLYVLNLDIQDVLKIFSKPAKEKFKLLIWTTLVEIINDYNTVWAYLENPFPSWFIFNNVFSHEKTEYNSVKNEISQKRNINRKKPHTISSQIFEFKVATRSFKIQYLSELELPKNWPVVEFFKTWKTKVLRAWVSLIRDINKDITYEPIYLIILRNILGTI